MAEHGHSETGAARPETAATLDTTAKFVRLTQVRPDGFVSFDFAIGEPEIHVEMLLPAKAFAEFCAANAVIRLDGTPARAAAGTDAAENNDFLWRLSDAARAAANTPANRSH